MRVKTKKYFNIIKSNEERGEIYIYDDIVSEGWRWGEETSAASFRDELKALEDVKVIDLRINSGGGDVFEAAAIYNMLKRHKARIEVHVDGLAASAASVVAMAGDKISMPKNAMLMIHNAWTFSYGNHHDFRKLADDLEKINESTVKQAYLSKNIELDYDEITRLMDEETWLTADEALELGLIDEVVQATKVAASITEDQLSQYKNVPQSLLGTSPQNNEGTSFNITVNINDIESSFDVNQIVEKIKSSLVQTKEPSPPDNNRANRKRFF